MRTELKKVELIEKYLAKTLTEEENISFENEMQFDKELYQEVFLQKKLQERLSILAFKSDLLNFENSANNDVTNNGFNFYKLGTIVLALLFSVGLFFQFFKNGEKKDLETKKFPIVETKKPDNNIYEESDFSNIVNDTILSKRVNSNKSNKKTSSFKIPKKLQVPFETVIINIEKGDTVTMNRSLSNIYIPANSIVDKKGTLVKGDVEIRYREFRNTGDIVFSKIPMVYNENDEKLRFNSAGMFEIRAYQNGEELELIPEKPLEIDYFLTERLEGLNFYRLDDNTQEWAYLNKIDLPIEDIFEKPSKLQLDTCVVINNTPSYKGGYEAYYKHIKNHPLYIAAKKYGLQGTSECIVGINKKGQVDRIVVNEVHKSTLIDSIAILIFKDMKEFTAGVIEKDTVTMPVLLSLRLNIDHHKDYLKSITYNNRKQERKISNKEALNFNEQINMLSQIVLKYIKKDTSDFNIYFGNQKKYEVNYQGINYSSLLSVNTKVKKGDTLCLTSETKEKHFSKKSKFYNSNLIQGVKALNFGTYNYDKIEMYKNKAAIYTKYLNEENEEIHPSYVSLIDFRVNGAFKSSPTFLVCDEASKNSIYLLEGDKIYIVSKKKFKKQEIYNYGSFTFKAIDYTATIKNPKDLYKHIKM